MKKTIVVSLFSLVLIGSTQAAGHHHPRRAEVNHRLSNQDKRIDHKVADGQMSKKEGARLHREDHQIRNEEKSMASQDKGHITKQEQKTLNQQENHVSKQITTH